MNEKVEKLYKSAKHQLEIEGYNVKSDDEIIIKGLFVGNLTVDQIIYDLKK